MKFVDVKNDIAFRKIKDADKHSWKKEELIAYDNASIAEQDERGKLVAAENKGKAEGKAEGKIEGKIEGNAEGRIAGKAEEKEGVIERCIKENMSPEMISKIVNLPISEVHKIIENIKKEKKARSK